MPKKPSTVWSGWPDHPVPDPPTAADVAEALGYDPGAYDPGGDAQVVLERDLHELAAAGITENDQELLVED